MVKVILYILLGLSAGTISGFVGIGGGVIIVPALVFFFEFTQKQAQGTTLALLVPPIGFLAAYAYWSKGHVDIPPALMIGGGLLVGGLIGAKFSQGLSNEILQKVFGGMMIAIGLYMMFRKADVG
jgi:uncharacterized membrane protein YfcA